MGYSLEVDKNGNIDLVSLFPEKFLELHYLTNFNTKKEILRKFKEALRGIGESKLSYNSATATSVTTIIKTSLEESNLLIFTESLSITGLLFRLMSSSFNYLITKDIILLAASKVY